VNRAADEVAAAERGARDHPLVIQGGMGVAISGWRLARAVALRGQLGVVSGTALETVHARRLEDGDRDGHLRRAYGAFPDQALAERVLDRWFLEEGRGAGSAYRSVPMFRIESPRALRELTIIANFAEVWLAKDGHDGLIGVNYLEKIQIPTPDALYGAMLAGVDYVTMGAGIPAGIPRLLDGLARHEHVSYKIAVEGAPAPDGAVVDFDPSTVVGGPVAVVRPHFLAIVSSDVLATFLAKDAATRPDGFVVEHHRAGGHNAPPRGPMVIDDRGEPVYGARDVARLEKIAALGLPFWIAGGAASPGMLDSARRAGAAGIQVGTAFALCVESGLSPELRDQTVAAARTGGSPVVTDPRASPSGYPFKVAKVDGTLSERDVYDARARRCDVGLLRTPYMRPDGRVGYRCPSEPEDAYVRKGGALHDTVGRVCLCNALLGTAGLAQLRDVGPEPPIVTLGDDVSRVVEVLGNAGSWTAADVLDYLLPDTAEARARTISAR